MSRFKESKGADGGHSLNRDFTVLWPATFGLIIRGNFIEKLQTRLIKLLGLLTDVYCIKEYAT